MRIWNTKKLRGELLSGDVSEREKMQYFLATMILYSVSGQLSGGEYSGGYFWAGLISVVSVTIIGIIISYKSNNKGDGVNFIERFICISWPITIKITFTFVLVLMVLHSTEVLSVNPDSDAFGIISILILEALYFWRITVHLGIIAKGELS